MGKTDTITKDYMKRPDVYLQMCLTSSDIMADADVDQEIVKYAADYHINLITPKKLSDNELDEFHATFREVMKFIKDYLHCLTLHALKSFVCT